MSKTYKGDVTGNVVELNLLDANESTLPNLGTPTVVTRNTGPNDVTQVVGDITSSSGFYFDTSAKGLVIGTSCTTIGSNAFYYCQNLNVSLVIPDSVTSIANGAFYSCSNLTAVYVDTPASSWIGTNALINTTFSTIYTGPNATGYTSSFQGRTGLTIANWDNYPNPIPN